MQNTMTKSAKKLALKLALALILVFAYLGTTESAKAQSYCNPYYYYPYYAYIYYLNFYNDSRSIDYWNYPYGYSYYPRDYTNTSFKDAQWSPGDRFNFYVYVQGNYNYMFHLRVWVDWNDDGDWDDAGEDVYKPASYTPYNRYNIRASFNIPTNAPAGQHRMRWVVGYYYYMWYYSPDACGLTSTTYRYYRSSNDYTLNIAPKNDAGVAGFLSPAEGFNSDDPQDVEVQIQNFSDLELQGADVSWSVGGVQQGTVRWTGTLAKDDVASVTIATGQTFTPQDPWDPFRFEAWTSNLVGEDAAANQLADGNPSNDRARADINCILNDASFVNADQMLPIDFGENDVIITVMNNAPKPLSRVTISYSVDGVAQQPYTASFNPALNRGETADVVVGTYFFGAGNVSYLIEAETSNPNGVTDQVPGNDAGSSEVYKALQAGTYTVGPRESDYESLVDIMEFIGYWGIAGPVDILIRQGTYYMSEVLTPRGGRQFPLTFESVSRRPLDVVIYNDGSKNDFILQFDGYDDVSFHNLTFEAPGTMFDFTGGNSNYHFDNCVFNGPQGGSKVMGMPDGGSIMTMDGDVSGLEILNSTFNNGYYSIYHMGYMNVSNWMIHDNEFNGASEGFIYLSDAMASNITIENNLFNGMYTPWGVYAWSAMDVNVLNNRFNGINAEMWGGYGAAVMLGSGYGTGIYTGSNNVIGNTITVVEANGVSIENGMNIVVEDNIISANGMGYSYMPLAAINDMYSDGTMIHGNTINVSDMTGIYTDGMNGLISYNQVFGSSRAYMTAGLALYYTSYKEVADNEIAVSGMPGIANMWSHEAYIAYNSVVSNDMYVPAYVHNFMDETVVKKERKDNSTLGKGPGTTMMMRNIFQNNAGGLAGYIEDQSYSLQSDNNNWWTSSTDVVEYNYTSYDFAGYQGASGQDPNSSSVMAMFMGPQDLRLTHVDADLYYTNQMLYGQQYTEYEEKDLAGENRTRAFYKGAYSLYPTIEVTVEPEDVVDCLGTTEHAFVVVANVDYNSELTYQWYKDGVSIFGQTGPILYINDPLDYEMGAVYRCKISGTGEADDIWTRPAMLYTLRPTEITRQPFDLRNDLGTVATFEIDMHIYKEAPAMFQPDIQWYRGNVMLMDNDRLAGTKSSIMTIRDVQADDLGDDYYVIISGLCGADTSDAITLSEIPSLMLDPIPAAATVCVGSDASFQVVATSSVPGVTIGYQWMKDGMPLMDGPRVTGAMTEQLLISMAEAMDAGDYTCVVSLGNWDQQTSNASTLTVDDKPMLTTDLEASVSVQTDKVLDLMVAATGTNLTYQWYMDDVEIAGATMSTYTKDSVSSADEGTYKVVVTNDCGDVVSAECVVTVTPFILLDVDGEAGEMMLNQNSPNPFATVTTIGFIMPEAGYARLTLTDVNGKEIAVIADGAMGQGLNSYEVDATALNLTAGVYFYTLNVNGKSITKTMVVLK